MQDSTAATALSDAERTTLPSERLLPRLFLILLLAVLALAGWQWRRGAPLSANLMELVPSTPDALELRAEQRMQEPLNREMLVLVGHADRQQAWPGRAPGQQWQASGLFEKVQWNLQADLPALRAQLLQGRLAMLSAKDREQLIDQPTPSSSSGCKPVRPLHRFQPGAEPGRLAGPDRAHPEQPAAARFGATGHRQRRADRRCRRQELGAAARAHHRQCLRHEPAAASGRPAPASRDADQARCPTAGGQRPAVRRRGQQQASREITWVGGGATLGILLLLLLAFRRWRVLLAFVPVLVGMLFGAVACVALFGHMHVMTLVLGSSLIGVAVDYPLHYLSKSWSLKPWHSWPALRLTLPGLSLSLATSAIGYLALAWTPFPALTQIAVFSAAGLLAPTSARCACCRRCSQASSCARRSGRCASRKP
jgi:predicted exporter